MGGATTGAININSAPPVIFPGYQQQVDDVLAGARRGRIDPRALYTVWVGANDFFAWLQSGSQDPTPMIAGGVTKRRRARSIAVAPTLGPRTAGASAMIRF